MKKRFLFTFKVETDIPDTITPEFIENIIYDVTDGVKVPIYQVRTEKHQAFIDFIKNNDLLYEKYLVGYILSIFKDSGSIIELRINDGVELIQFDESVREIGRQMTPECRVFLNNIYHLEDDYDKDDKEDDLEDVMSDYPTEDEMEEIKLNIDRMIIQESLLNFEITAVDLKAVENAASPI